MDESKKVVLYRQQREIYQKKRDLYAVMRKHYHAINLLTRKSYDLLRERQKLTLAGVLIDETQQEVFDKRRREYRSEIAEIRFLIDAVTSEISALQRDKSLWLEDVLGETI